MGTIRPNRVKRKLAAGETVVSLAGLDTPDQIDLMGPAGLDAAWLEAEHGPVDFGRIPDLTRACDLWGITSIVRVNALAYGPIYRTLDLGAQGVCVPHIDTAADARAFVEAAKFAPIGRRGLFTSRQGYGVADYLQVANDHTALIALIEDIKAVENLDAILEVDHIDGVLMHIEHHDVSYVAIARAPLSEIEAVKRRMNWRFRFVSSFGSDFNYDFGVSFTPEQMSAGKAIYNYHETAVPLEDLSGLSVFCKDESGAIYHTYSAFGRGAEEVLGAYMYLDLVPKGRDEDKLPYPQAWWRHHDRYETAGPAPKDVIPVVGSCCG